MIDATIVADSSAWNAVQIEDFLTTTIIPCRLSCISRDGFPHVNSLWFLYVEGALWLSTQRSTAVCRWLQASPRCGFEVAGDQPPYRGVRGRGHAAIVAGREAPMLPRLIERYLGDSNARLARWLLSREHTEATIRIEPCWLTTWDYGARMGPGR